MVIKKLGMVGDDVVQSVRGADQLALLRELASSRTAPLRRVQRAHVVLACAHGTANAVIARMLRLHLDTVRRWRKRFTAEGLAALKDRPRPGHPRRYGPQRLGHLAFLRLLEHAVPADSTIHLILDNGSSHTSKATRSWLAKHPRCRARPARPVGTCASDGAVLLHYRVKRAARLHRG